MSYQTTPVARGDLTVEVTATGTLQPLTQVEVSTELSGVVRDVPVEENQRVAKGDVLARLDTSRIEAQIARAKASVQAAQAKVDDAQVTLKETTRAFERSQKLADRGMVATEALDTAAAARDRANAAVETAQANLAIAQADLTLEQQDLDKSTIYAPIDGVVLTRSVNPGQTVAASTQAPVLFVIAQDLEQMELDASVDEADIGSVAAGQKAHFTVDAFPQHSFDAAIRDISFASTETEGVVTYEARLDVGNPDLLLRPGMTASVSIVTREAKDVLLVPNSAFRFSPPETQESRGFSLRDLFSPRFPRFGRGSGNQAAADGTRTLWVLKDGAPSRVTVKTGATDGEMTEVLSGPRRRRQRHHRHLHPRVGCDAMSEAPLISFENVWKTYGRGEAEVHALAGVDLSVREGEFVAIMGPSGSGKSTAMNIIGCLDTPTSGRYGFMGVDAGRLDRGSRAVLRNRYIGFVFQGYNLLPRTTAAENVELPLVYRGVPGRDRRRLAMEALEQVGLAGREDHTPAELSGGQQQRVAIARAIVTRPSLLVADEPTGNLDTQRSHEIMELLTGLNEASGLTVLMVTHEADIAGFAQRIIGFLDGHIASDRLRAEAA